MTNIEGSVVGTLAGLGQLSLTLVVSNIHRWGVVVQLTLIFLGNFHKEQKLASLADYTKY